jgi:hypothetical protein
MKKLIIVLLVMGFFALYSCKKEDEPITPVMTTTLEVGHTYDCGTVEILLNGSVEINEGDKQYLGLEDYDVIKVTAFAGYYLDLIILDAKELPMVDDVIKNEGNLGESFDAGEHHLFFVLRENLSKGETGIKSYYFTVNKLKKNK